MTADGWTPSTPSERATDATTAETDQRRHARRQPAPATQADPDEPPLYEIESARRNVSDQLRDATRRKRAHAEAPASEPPTPAPAPEMHSTPEAVTVSAHALNVQTSFLPDLPSPTSRRR